jgi:hypothetical protein
MWNTLILLSRENNNQQYQKTSAQTTAEIGCCLAEGNSCGDSDSDGGCGRGWGSGYRCGGGRGNGQCTVEAEAKTQQSISKIKQMAAKTTA